MAQNALLLAGLARMGHCVRLLLVIRKPGAPPASALGSSARHCVLSLSHLREGQGQGRGRRQGVYPLAVVVGA